jgi:hypothetical protein
MNEVLVQLKGARVEVRDELLWQLIFLIRSSANGAGYFNKLRGNNCIYKIL